MLRTISRTNVENNLEDDPDNDPKNVLEDDQKNVLEDDSENDPKNFLRTRLCDPKLALRSQLDDGLRLVSLTTFVTFGFS